MAVDQALLASANQTGQVTLRFYRWSPATLSLGYFQSVSQRVEHEASLGCPLVRRVTGGGAILHDRELTYSLCVPRHSRLAGAHAELYRQVHRALIETLRDSGIVAALCTAPQSAPGNPPFLCFQRRSEGDVVIGKSKICGSAQRRFHAAVLQHGSVVLARSAWAPEILGIGEECGIELDERVLSLQMAERIGQSLQLSFQPSRLSEKEQLDSHEIQRKQFDHSEWNTRR